MKGRLIIEKGENMMKLISFVISKVIIRVTEQVNKNNHGVETKK